MIDLGGRKLPFKLTFSLSSVMNAELTNFEAEDCEDSSV
jgi:hypothetical protein